MENEGKLLAFQITLRLCEVSALLSLQQYIILFFILPCLLSCPSISFSVGSALTLVVFGPPLYFWCWYLTPCCFPRSCTGPQPNVLTALTKCASTLVPRPCLLVFLFFSNPSKHSGEAEHNSCKQVLYKKGGGIC